MRIKKVEESILPKGHVINSLEVGSSTNAPSINAVKNYINGTVLYESTEGTNGNVLFNSSVLDGDILEIYWSSYTGDAYEYYNVSKVFIKGDSEGWTKALLNQNRIDSNGIHFDTIGIKINMLEIQIGKARYYQTINPSVTDITNFKIYKVVKYQ